MGLIDFAVGMIYAASITLLKQELRPAWATAICALLVGIVNFMQCSMMAAFIDKRIMGARFTCLMILISCFSDIDWLLDSKDASEDPQKNFERHKMEAFPKNMREYFIIKVIIDVGIILYFWSRCCRQDLK